MTHLLKTTAALCALALAACGGEQTAAAPQETAPESIAATPRETAAPAAADAQAPEDTPIVDAASELPTDTSPDLAHKIMVVLDSSGSMWGQIEGTPKRDIAAKTLTDMVPRLDKNADIGLVTYGHRRKGDCADIEAVLPAVSGSREQIGARISQLKSLGKTPLTSAVSQAAETLALEEDKTTIILITDGIETCKGDPCALGRTLEERGIDFTAHVIGFGLSTDEGRQVSCLADETGGLYLSAQNADELDDALKTVTDDIEAEPEAEIAGPATVKVLTPTVRAGANVSVEWSGPQASLDALVVRKPNDDDRFDRTYIYSEDAVTPADVRAPDTPGEYEVHYQTRKGKSLASDTFNVVPATATVDAPDMPIIANTYFSVTFKADVNPSDKIVLYSEDDPSDILRLRYVENAKDSALKLMAPIELGEYTIAYQTRGGTRLATDEITVVAPKASVDGPDEPVRADTYFAVKVSDNPGEFDQIFLVDPNGDEDQLDRAYVKNAKDGEVKLRAPVKPGDYRLDYVQNDDTVLATDAITVFNSTVSVKPPEGDIIAGAYFSIALEGEGGDADKVGIVNPENDKKDFDYGYAKNRRDGAVRLLAPQAAGTYEIRWRDRDDQALATGSIIVVAPDPSMKVPSSVKAGERFEIGLSEKHGEFDQVIIVSPAEPDEEIDKRYMSNADAVIKLTAPKTAGTYELRYMNRDKRLLNTETLNVVK